MTNINQSIQSKPTQQTLRKWWILAAMCLIIVIIATDITALNIALPAIGRNFHATLSQLQWIINTYIIACATFAVNGGKLGDSFGHRKLFVIGVAVFGLASLLCGFAPNVNILIIGRALQGLGAAMAFPVTNVIIFAAFEERYRGFAISMISATSGATQSIAPTLGGFIVKYLSWHWIFFINIPIVILAIILTMLFCPKHIIPPHHKKFDSKGTTCLTLSLLLLMFALNEAQNWGMNSLKFILCVVISIILLTVFIKVEIKTPLPLINLKLFANKIFTLVNSLRFLISFTWMISLFILGLCLQNILLFDPVTTGLLMLCMTGFFAIASPFIGKLVDAIGGRIPIIIALPLFIGAFILFANIQPTHSMPQIIIGLILLGLGFAGSAPSSNTIAIATVETKYIGMANSIYLTVSFIGNACGAAVAGTIMSLSSFHMLKQQLIANHITLTTSQLNIAKQIADGSFSVNLLGKIASPNMATKLLPIIQQTNLHAFAIVMYMCIGLTLVGLVMTLLTKRQANCSKY